MAGIFKLNLCIGLFLMTSGLMASDAHGQIAHVSINEKQFVLGGYPKLRVNIISDHDSLAKMQFIVRQANGEERLMMKSINNYLVLVSGVDDVIDPGAQLIVKEYRVNKWRLVKTLDLFDTSVVLGASFTPASMASISPKAIASKATVKTTVKVTSTVTAVSQKIVSKSARVASANHGHCKITHDSTMTLWRIGMQYGGQWQISTYAAMLAIFDANPGAFNQGNIHGLRADANLLCPSQALIDKYPDKAVAKQTFNAL